MKIQQITSKKFYFKIIKLVINNKVRVDYELLQIQPIYQVPDRIKHF